MILRLTLGEVVGLAFVGLLALAFLLLWLAGLVIGAVERVNGWFRRAAKEGAKR
jgi:hypothetical protein